MSKKVPNRNPFHRRLREYKLIFKGLLSTDHPVVAHIIPIRRCNLACAYCNEYDDHSAGIPLDVMKSRIKKLASLGLSALVFSGGEPLLHPHLDEMISYSRSLGILTALITNGYLLVPDRIKRLNQAGLDYMQISIDNLEPDDVSFKSMKVLDKKLQMLHEHATFAVNINSVIGGGIRNPKDALVIGKRAVEFGFSTTVGIIHDGHGQLGGKSNGLNEVEQSVFHELRTIGKTSYARFNKFQNNLALGLPNDWKCRAGSRYLYICEDGLVHYCSQRRGYPGIPLSDYSVEDIRREYNTKKDCAPFCTVACVHKVATLDNWRRPQTLLDMGSKPSLPPSEVGLSVQHQPQLIRLQVNRKSVKSSSEEKDLEVVNADF
ncbi:MAG: radical SAM protein [Blastocatellia bacterium]|nr:radical SAM protein [Blastocatellia bacterium]